MQNFMFLLSLYQQKTMLNYQNYWLKDLKRLVYWNEDKVIPEQRYNANDSIRKLIDPSYANSIVNSHRKYFLPKVEMKKSQHWNWWKKFLWSTN